MLEFAVPRNAVVVSGKKNIKSAAENMGRQNLRKKLCGGSRNDPESDDFHQNLLSEANGHAKTFLLTMRPKKLFETVSATNILLQFLATLVVKSQWMMMFYHLISNK